MDGHPPPRVRIRRLYPVFAVQQRKHELADIRARMNQRALAQPIGQVLPEAPHNVENRLRRFRAVRYLHRQRPRSRNRLQEKSRRNVRRNSYLPRFQHNILLAASPSVLSLCPVQLQQLGATLLQPDLQHLGNQQIAYALLFQLLIKKRSELLQQIKIALHSLPFANRASLARLHSSNCLKAVFTLRSPIGERTEN